MWWNNMLRTVLFKRVNFAKSGNTNKEKKIRAKRYGRKLFIGPNE